MVCRRASLRHLLLTLVALAALGALAAPASAETISVTDRTFSCDQTYPASRGLVVEVRITGPGSTAATPCISMPAAAAR